MRAPGLPYFSTAGRFDVIDSSFDMFVRPYVSRPITGPATRSSGLGAGVYGAVAVCLFLFATATARPPPRSAPAVKTAACTMAALGILEIGSGNRPMV